MDRKSKRAGVIIPGACALAAALAPVQALAGDYWFLGAGTNVYDFVDVTQITPTDDGARQAWTTRVLEGKGSTGKKVKTVLSLAIFYCGQDAMRLVTQVQYRGNGALKSNQDFPQGRLQRVTPGTLGAAEYDFVCLDPFARSDKYRDLGDIEPAAKADELARQASGRRR